MKLISWNVNGLRAVLKKGFLDYLAQEDPDILCIQETKASPEQGEQDFPGYRAFWNAAERKGYSGTLVLSKIPPLQAANGIKIEAHDREGRVVTLEYPDFYLVNVYTPNAQRDLARLDYRTRQWDVDFLKYVKGLEKQKPVVFCGDLNVAHREIDLANPRGNRGNAGFTDEERASFDNIIAAGFIDTFREFQTEGGHYTWWSYMGRAREKNVGWRIDYFCISASLRPRLQDAFIRPEVSGSDHCPIGIILS